MFPVGGYSFGFLQTGGGGGGGGTVLSVTGNIVDNTDPNNPVVTQIFEVFTEIIAQTGGTNDFTFSDTNLVTYRINAVYRFAATSLNISLDTAVRVKANALAFITLKDQDGSTDLPVSYFQQGKYYDFIYNGTNFVLVTTINEAIPVTYAGAQTLISGNNLIPNIDYLITDKADVGIKLRAETNDTFGISGVGGFLNPDFKSVGVYSGVSAITGIAYNATKGVWNAYLESNVVIGEQITGVFTIGENVTSDLGPGVAGVVVSVDTAKGVITVSSPNAGLISYGATLTGSTSGAQLYTLRYLPLALSVGNVVFWNGLHYQVISTAFFNGTNPATNLSSYTVLAKTDANVGYIEVWDDVEFDFSHSYIKLRKDKSGNKVDCSYEVFQYFVSQLTITATPVNAFQWGNDYVKTTGIGIGSCLIIDSYYEIINVCAQSLTQISMSNKSYAYLLTIDSSSYQANIILTNSSYMYSITLTNNSYQLDLSLDNSFIYECVIDRYSHQGGITLVNSSALFDNTQNLNAIIDRLFLINSSTVQSCGIIGSVQSNKIGRIVDFFGEDSGKVVNITITNSTIQFLNIRQNSKIQDGSIAGDSVVSYINVIENSSIVDFVIDTASIVTWISVGNSCLLDTVTISACQMLNCEFNMPNTTESVITFSFASETIQNKTVKTGFSNFEATIDITGLTNIEIPLIYNYCGIFNVTSSNTVENIQDISGTNFYLPYTPFKIVPQSGLTITFINTPLTTPILPGNIYLPDTTIDVDGTLQYWIEFKRSQPNINVGGYSEYIYSLPPLSSGGGGGGGGSTPLYFVDASTTGVLTNTPAYNNGTGGVGATLTAGSNGALPNQDGVALVVGDRLLVQNQVAALQNGIYEVTDLGSGGTPYILTRVVDYDTTGEVYPSQVNVQNGTLYSGRYFLQQTVNPVIGTNSIVYLVSPTPASGTGRVVPADTVTTEILPNVPAYTNGTAGVGARLTATVNGAFPTINGLAPFLNMRVLVTSQAAALQNGIYRLAIIGSGSSVWRLVRTTDADASNEMYPSSVVIWGGYYNNTIWQQKSKAPTIGTTSIVYTLETVVSLSYTEAQTLITNSKVVVGQQYLINDLAAGDGGTNGLGVLLVGVDENNYSIAGNGGFLNPDFANNGNDVSADANYAGVFGVTGVNPATNLGIWSIQKTVAYINGTQTGTFTIGENLSSTLGVGVAGVVVDNTNDGYVVVSSPNAGLLNGGDISGDTSGATITAATYTAVEYVNGDIVFWNGLHYQIIDVSLFDTDNPSVNVTAYQVLPKNVANVGYVTAWDAIEFDFTNELIIKRSDKLGNVYLCSYVAGVALGMPYVFGVNTDFTETMQWGNTFCYSNIISESFVSILNQSSFYKNTITDYSFVLGNDQVIQIYNNFVSNGSYLTYNTNGGSIYFTIGSPSILDNKIFLNSTITANVFSGGEISANEVSASSFISANILDNKAVINTNYLTIGSTIDSNTVGYFSSILQNKIADSSGLQSNVLGSTCQIAYNVLSFSSLIVANDMAESTCMVNNVVANSSAINSNIMSEVGGLNVIYNNNLNFTSTINSNTMDAGAKIYNNELIEQSVIDNNDCSSGLIIDLNKLRNKSFIQFSVVGASPGACLIELNTLDDNCIIDTNTFSSGSSITNNTMLGSSQISNNELGQTCSIDYNFMNTTCIISSNTMEDSDCAISYNIMSRGTINSNIMGAGGGDAHVSYNTLDYSDISSNTMDYKANIFYNILEPQSFISSNILVTTGFITGNHLFSNAQITTTSIGSGSAGMAGNILECSAGFSSNTISGAKKFHYNIIASRCNLSNKTMSANITENYFGIICDQTETWSAAIDKKRCESGFSNFEATISITGATTLAITTVFPYVGIFNLTSANATETINTITNFPTLCPFKLLPASGLTVTFTGTAIAGIAADKIALPTASFVANGTNTDWIVLQASSAHVEQVDAMNYI